MKEVKVLCAEAFSNQENKGNPAGLVFDADWINDNEMQHIANKIDVHLFLRMKKC